MINTKCCGCNKELFGPRGTRLVDKCYQIGIQAKVNGGKYYSDMPLARTYLCEECFNKPAAQVVRLLEPIVDNAQACERMSPELPDDSYGSFIPMCRKKRISDFALKGARMTDVEFEERLAYVEYNIDRLHAHVLMLNGFLLGVVLVFITTLFL